MRILVVEDDHDTRETFAQALEDNGHTVDAAPTPEEALYLFGANRPDAVLLDWNLPGIGGRGFIEQLGAARLSGVRVVIVTASLSLIPAVIHDVIVDAILRKPFDLSAVPHALGCDPKESL